MEEEKTPRGFRFVAFSDRYDMPCTLQESSLATEAAIWFGATDDEGHRMHLTQERVAALLPFLLRFIETGHIGDW